MSHEIELKFRIPADRLDAVRRAMATAGARRIALAAVYVDTPGQDLAGARGALRLRREGERWVQTLKAEGQGPLLRLEHEVVLPPGAEPQLDVARHAGTPAGDWLARVMKRARQPTLGERYATEVTRTVRQLRSGGAVLELALDEGAITADGGRRRRPLSELEIELKSGPVAALLAVAGRWVARFGLVLDSRSKSEAGHLLAQGLDAGPPAPARPPVLPADATLPQARALLLADPLRQVLANASVLGDAGSGSAALPEHLHQLRVGLRRLRGVLGLGGPLGADWDPAWSGRLRALFDALGAQRDADVATAWLVPALQAAGAPPISGLTAPTTPSTPVATPAATGVDVLLCAPATQALWLALLGASMPPAASSSRTGTGSAVAALVPPMARLFDRVRRDAAAFTTLDDEGRHRLRRRVKRLRYLLEDTAACWRRRRTVRLLEGLAEAQRVLGDYHDTVVALARGRDLAATDGAAWFAVGWLAARRTALEAPCGRALQRLAACRSPFPRSD